MKSIAIGIFTLIAVLIFTFTLVFVWTGSAGVQYERFAMAGDRSIDEVLRPPEPEGGKGGKGGAVDVDLGPDMDQGLGDMKADGVDQRRRWRRQHHRVDQHPGIPG